jgi:hypothetical protein
MEIKALSRSVKDLLPSADALESLRKRTNPAELVYDRLLEHFRDFESQLDGEHEIGLRLVAFGENKLYHIIKLSYDNPDILIFGCSTDDGRPVELIQNVTQLNILLCAVPKSGPEPKRIGFNVPSDE